jgi:hypothetical protein
MLGGFLGLRRKRAEGGETLLVAPADQPAGSVRPIVSLPSVEVDQATWRYGVAGKRTGKAAGSAAGKVLGSKSATAAAKRTAASDLAQVGNNKKTGAAAASAAGKTLASKNATAPAKRAAASDLAQRAKQKKG